LSDQRTTRRSASVSGTKRTAEAKPCQEASSGLTKVHMKMIACNRVGGPSVVMGRRQANYSQTVDQYWKSAGCGRPYVCECGRYSIEETNGLAALFNPSTLTPTPPAHRRISKTCYLLQFFQQPRQLGPLLQEVPQLSR